MCLCMISHGLITMRAYPAGIDIGRILRQHYCARSVLESLLQARVESPEIEEGRTIEAARSMLAIMVMFMPRMMSAFHPITDKERRDQREAEELCLNRSHRYSLAEETREIIESNRIQTSLGSRTQVTGCSNGQVTGETESNRSDQCSCMCGWTKCLFWLSIIARLLNEGVITLILI